MRMVNKTQTQVTAFHISPVKTVQQGGQTENQQTREWINAQKMSHKHNKDPRCPQQLSPGMQRLTKCHDVLDVNVKHSLLMTHSATMS